jgi:uncharacterized protein (DUF427 family)
MVGEPVANNLVWSYERPLHYAAAVSGVRAFFDERIDLVLDGIARGTAGDALVLSWCSQ